MNTDSTGNNAEALLDRRHLLTQNLEKITAAMKQSGMTDPVGFIVDARDTQGREFVLAKYRSDGATEEEAVRRLDQENSEYAAKRLIPTQIIMAPINAAREILPCSSPTATESLRSWESQRQPGQYLVVVMANGGNTYATVEIGDDETDVNAESRTGMATAREGQHRVRVFTLKKGIEPR